MGHGIDWTGVFRRATRGLKGSGGTKGRTAPREPILPANSLVAFLYVAFSAACFWVHPALGVIAFIACIRRLHDNYEPPEPTRSEVITELRTRIDKVSRERS